MTRRAALILSGGKARRFQTQQQSWQDKALTELEGKPLLVHAIENVKDVVDEVVVCVNNEERKVRYTELLGIQGLKAHIVVDEKADISGPNVAIMTGLKATQAKKCLIVPCDMPFVKPEVANYLFTASDGFEDVVPMWPNGRLETLIVVLQREIGLEIVETLCQLKRPRSDDIHRAASKTLLASPMKTIRTLDPELKSFININTQEDLKKLQTRRLNGSVKDNIILNRGVPSVSDLQLMRNAVGMLKKGNFGMAQKTFELCKSRFEFGSSFFWAGVAGEGKGETLLEHAKGLKVSDSKLSVALDFEGKETFFDAANCYRNEAEIYKKNSCLMLLERALADKTWCESWVMGKTGQPHRYKLKNA
ncbi:MAG: molybdenum cofactor guanylyltransferase [Candidatus Bathyarchaeia archaeon]|jgi:molybdopterin-guanine dinucleotide biosynthesis protein A